MTLRVALADRGFLQKEREIICSQKRHNQNVFEWVAFDLTTEWGSNLARPWIIVISIWVICVLCYFVMMLLFKDSGVLIVLPSKFVRPRHSWLSAAKPTGQIGKPDSYPVRSSTLSEYTSGDFDGVYPWLRILWWASFYSAMSTFNIGFRDINFGRWLKLLTRTEFDLKAFGWARVVAGLQALVSVYLVALWFVSFVGKPFG